MKLFPRSKYSPHIPVLKHPQFPPPHIVRDQVSHPYRTGSYAIVSTDFCVFKQQMRRQTVLDWKATSIIRFQSPNFLLHQDLLLISIPSIWTSSCFQGMSLLFPYHDFAQISDDESATCS
jgi:hypothetical protein